MLSHGAMQIGMNLLDSSVHIFAVETLIHKLFCFSLGGRS
jgi:hypothetical protein